MRELLTKYGDVGYIWLTVAGRVRGRMTIGREMYGFIRRLQPATLIDNRIEPRRWSYLKEFLMWIQCIPARMVWAIFQGAEWQLGNYDARQGVGQVSCACFPRRRTAGWSWDGDCDEAAIMQRPCCIPHEC